jgi:hypothetical protein
MLLPRITTNKCWASRIKNKQTYFQEIKVTRIKKAAEKQANLFASYTTRLDQ